MSSPTPTTPWFRLYRARPLEIIDTTLREGQQTSLLHDYGKYFFTIEDKQDLLRALILYGVKFIELFAPNVSPQEREGFAVLKEVRDSLIPQTGYSFLLAHVRCHPQDVQTAIEAGVDGLNLYMGTSSQSQEFNHGQGLDRVARQTHDLLVDIRREAPHLILRFSGEDAYRTPLDDIYRVYDPIDELVDRLGMPDTVGVATPGKVRERVTALRKRYPDTSLETHFHDDRGFSLVNALEAVRCGAQYVDTTLLGVGERSGITSMTALLFNLFLERSYDALESYHLRGSYPINVLAAERLNTLVPAKEPVSLTNRTHTAGVHQGAVLKDSTSYEAYPLDMFGVSAQDILLGPLSGWHMVHYFLKEIHYFDITPATAREITAVFKDQVYSMLNGGRSPADVLLKLAKNHFHLEKPARLSAGPTLVQNLDEKRPEPHRHVTRPPVPSPVMEM